MRVSAGQKCTLPKKRKNETGVEEISQEFHFVFELPFNFECIAKSSWTMRTMTKRKQFKHIWGFPSWKLLRPVQLSKIIKFEVYRYSKELVKKCLKKENIFRKHFWVNLCLNFAPKIWKIVWKSKLKSCGSRIDWTWTETRADL